MTPGPPMPAGDPPATDGDASVNHVRVPTSNDIALEFSLKDDDAVIVEVNGRQYAGVTMPSEDHPVEVVYWRDEDSEDNVTVRPPGTPTEWPDEASDATETCVHCGRVIVQEQGRWVDPQATGDDSVWRETCDAHDTFEAEHEPEFMGTP